MTNKNCYSYSFRLQTAGHLQEASTEQEDVQTVGGGGMRVLRMRDTRQCFLHDVPLQTAHPFNPQHLPPLQHTAHVADDEQLREPSHIQVNLRNACLGFYTYLCVIF